MHGVQIEFLHLSFYEPRYERTRTTDSFSLAENVLQTIPHPDVYAFILKDSTHKDLTV